MNWTLHRALVDLGNVFRPFNGDRVRALFLTVTHEISLAQVFPFFRLAKALDIQPRELPVKRYDAGHNPYADQCIDYVFLQTWFDLSVDAMNALLDRIEKDWPQARIIYLDWFAPTDLRYAKVLNDRVTAYVKKQILGDFSQYNRPTYGESNLTDYYGRRYGIPMREFLIEVPLSFERKIILGTGFEYSPRILCLLAKKASIKSIDVHARVKANGVHWYQKLRDEAHVIVRRELSGLNLAINGRVSPKEYNRELFASRMCFSPFGYGEVCWRDFEAMAAGAALLKPDMSHLKLANDLFTKDTYIPLKWDLADLREKVETVEWNSIADNALNTLRQITARKTVVAHLKRILSL